MWDEKTGITKKMLLILFSIIYSIPSLPSKSILYPPYSERKQAKKNSRPSKNSKAKKMCSL
jgi:hypothetical protein